MPAEQPYEPPHSWVKNGAPMDLDVPIDSFGGDGSISMKGKRKMSDDAMGGVARIGRTLGGDRKVEAPGPVKQLGKWGGAGAVQVQSHISVQQLGSLLPGLPLLSYLKSEVEELDSFLEVRNSEEDRELLLTCLVAVVLS